MQVKTLHVSAQIFCPIVVFFVFNTFHYNFYSPLLEFRHNRFYNFPRLRTPSYTFINLYEIGL